MIQEWPLVFFTVLAQTATGTYLAVQFLAVFHRLGLFSENISYHTPALLSVIISILTVAIFISLFHLRRPWRTYRIFRNIRTSWLSREIFFLLLFVLLLLISAFSSEVETLSHYASLIQGTASLAGILFIYSMSRIYMLVSVAAWNHLSTPVSFYLTAFTLGFFGAGFLFALKGIPDRFAFIDVLTLMFILFSFFWSLAFSPGLGWLRSKDKASLRPGNFGPARLHYFRLAFQAVSLLALTFLIISGYSFQHSAGFWLRAGALVSFLSGEVLGRIFFYSFQGRRTINKFSCRLFL